jgi:hypothetical protein
MSECKSCTVICCPRCGSKFVIGREIDGEVKYIDCLDCDYAWENEGEWKGKTYTDDV